MVGSERAQHDETRGETAARLTARRPIHMHAHEMHSAYACAYAHTQSCTAQARRPSPKELRVIFFDGDADTLGRVESFFLQLADVPRLAPRSPRQRHIEAMHEP